MIYVQMTIALMLAIVATMFVMRSKSLDRERSAIRFLYLVLPLFLIAWASVVWLSDMVLLGGNVPVLGPTVVVLFVSLLYVLILPNKPVKALYLEGIQKLAPHRKLLFRLFSIGYWMIVAIFSALIYAGYQHMQIS